MVGTLLEDIDAGMHIDEVKRRFTDKMNPTKYQRPQALPSAGNVRQAEKIFAELGLERSMRRRYARFEEVPKIWEQRRSSTPIKPGGIFSDIETKVSKKTAPPKPTNTTPQPITWVKFAYTVLPKALKVEAYIFGRTGFFGLTTAVHADAPPILQWDSEEFRNPFAQYFYSTGSMPSQWGLRSSEYVNVPGIILKPSMWYGEDRFPHHGKDALLILEGAMDTTPAHLCLFPETLRGELHQVRSTIEAYSRGNQLEEAEKGSANGIKAIGTTVRVTTDIGVTLYKIDRWD